MEKEQVVEITFEGHEDIIQFAQGILVLTNLKSSVRESVVDFRTVEGSNLVHALVYKSFAEQNESYLQHHMGKIIDTEAKELWAVLAEDLKPALLKALEAQSDKYFNDEALEPILHLSPEDI